MRRITERCARRRRTVPRMEGRRIEVRGAAEHNLRDVDVDIGPGLTAVGLGIHAEDEELRAPQAVTRAELATMVARALSAAVESGATQVPSGR